MTTVKVVKLTLAKRLADGAIEAKEQASMLTEATMVLRAVRRICEECDHTVVHPEVRFYMDRISAALRSVGS